MNSNPDLLDWQSGALTVNSLERTLNHLSQEQHDPSTDALECHPESPGRLALHNCTLTGIEPTLRSVYGSDRPTAAASDASPAQAVRGGALGHYYKHDRHTGSQSTDVVTVRPAHRCHHALIHATALARSSRTVDSRQHSQQTHCPCHRRRLIPGTATGGMGAVWYCRWLR